jgi:molybdopterin/thiamine biosynthesis adenylyltransferase
MNLDKYFHTTFLKEIGIEGQKKLLNSHILVIGGGGLAASSLLYLVSIGIGHIDIIDDDKIEYNNLPRQIIFDEEDVGKYKVDVLKEKLEKKNKDVNINVIKSRLDKSNASKIILNHDIVLEFTDNFETKFLVNDTCLKLNIPFVIAGVSDYQGQVLTCIPNKTKDFKSLFSELPVNIDEKYKEEDQGVFPPSIGVISDIATSEAIKYLLNIGDLLTNKLLVVILLSNKYHIIEIIEKT